MCATMYGSVHGGFRVANMDKLPGSKMVTIFASGVYGPILAPLYVINDINRGFMWKHGLKFTDYGYPEKDETIADVLFR